MKSGKKKLFVMGDRVLIEPVEGEDRTAVGLYLPQTVTEKENVQSGRIIATGPGIPLPDPGNLDDEPWKKSYEAQSRYIPMQVQAGDYVIYLRKAAIEIKYDGKTYIVVPQAAILVILRDNDLGDLLNE